MGVIQGRFDVGVIGHDLIPGFVVAPYLNPGKCHGSDRMRMAMVLNEAKLWR